MLLSHSKQFIYLKTGKTASTSVEIFFQPYCLPPNHVCYHSPTHEIDETISEHGIVGYRGKKPSPKNIFYNHMPALKIKNLIEAHVWENYFKFCVMRNPFDKIISFWWFHLSEEKRTFLRSSDFSIVKNSFKESLFSDTLLLSNILLLDHSIYKIDHSPCVDYFIRFEYLQEDLTFIIKKLSLSLDLNTLKKYKSDTRGKNNHFSEYYDNKMIDLVKKAFAWEVDYFGYECY